MHYSRKQFHTNMDMMGHNGTADTMERSSHFKVTTFVNNGTVKITADIMERWTLWTIAIVPKFSHTDTMERLKFSVDIAERLSQRDVTCVRKAVCPNH